jgi:high-affinity iron transporter
MHSQSLAGRWQAYIHAKIKAHLSKQSLWGLAALSFVAVYREIFETVLFYSAMWEQGAHHAIIAGIGVASIALFAVGYFLFSTSRRLPIREYFLYSSLFVGFIAVVIAGKAAKSLQEAGWLQVTQLPTPTFDWLGLFPTLQTLLIQVVVLAVVVIGFWFNNRKPQGAKA